MFFKLGLMLSTSPTALITFVGLKANKLLGDHFKGELHFNVQSIDLLTIAFQFNLKEITINYSNYKTFNNCIIGYVFRQQKSYVAWHKLSWILTKEIKMSMHQYDAVLT